MQNKIFGKSNMNEVKFLSGMKKPKISQLGGKGYSLAILINKGFNVPKGFVVSSGAFFEYLNQNDLTDMIEKLNSEINENNFQKKSKKIKSLIMGGKIPDRIVSEIKENLRRLNVEYVSVRSSALGEDSLKDSFAGMHDTFLNVKAESKSVLKNVKKCWASLFNQRAIIYRLKKGISNKYGMAVILQEMIPSELSGIAFTRHPTNQRALLIESTKGLGDRIVGGKVIPDQYVMDRKRLILLEKNTNRVNKPLRILTLKGMASVFLKIENIFNKPQDIEWCIFRGNLWILQSRAITTSSPTAGQIITGNPIITGIGASPGVAQGRVKIMLNYKDIQKMQEGDILVTVMTNPLYITAIQKAKAIITDVGGMICHAAIVARELGIPCIVGTKNGTKTLKDDMEVIVNGAGGTVYVSN